GTLKEDIKDYIQTAYETWDIPPAFVLLVGDADDDQIPAWEWGDPCIGDNEYGCVDGTDYYPDVLPGRFACDAESQVMTFVAKHLNYEMHPDTTDDWMLRSVGLVREEDCPFDPHGPDDSSYVAAVTYMLDQCDSVGYASAELFTKCSGDVAATVRPYIEAGCNFISFRGQGVSDWWSPFGGLQQLPTGDKCPITVSITCGMGDFHSGDGRPCETSTRAGTASSPRGSVAYIGQAAISSNTIERSSLSKHIFEGFFPAKLNALAAAHTYGKLEMLAELYPVWSGAEYEYKTSTLVGSPEMAAWTDSIRSPELDYIPNVPIGAVDFEVAVSTGGLPKEGARIVVHTDSTFSYAMTDSSGHATVSLFVEPGAEPILVVTGSNIYPFCDTLGIIASGAAIFSAPSTFEEVVGNGDGLPNPGETVRIIPRIFNIGIDSVDGLIGNLHCPSGITMIDSISNFPAMGTWDSASGDAIEFSISPDYPATESLGIELVVSGHPDGPWELGFLPVCGVYRFRAIYDDMTIYDEPLLGGDDDGVLDPSETAELELRLVNPTLATALSIEATLEGSSDIFVIQKDAEYFDWASGDTVILAPRFTVSTAPSAMTSDDTLMLFMAANCGTYEYSDTFEIPIHISGTPSFTSPWLLPVGEILVDDSLGDGDGIIEPREPIEIFVDVTNFGASSASDVRAAVVMSPFFFPIDSGTFGDIDVFDTVRNVTAIVCSTASYTPSDTTLFVPIRLVSGEYTTTIVGRIDVGEGSAIGEVASPLKPDEISISAYPNPFNSAVSISVGASHASPVTIEIYDIAGRMVAELSPRNCIRNSAPLIKGVFTDNDSPLNKGGCPEGTGGILTWQPEKSLGSGVYLVRARFGDCEISRRVVYLK
ncbi:hypothetical protein J7L01_02935, partial [bacterium]|nr:hypothetical protein [bacterium]